MAVKVASKKAQHVAGRRRKRDPLRPASPPRELVQRFDRGRSEASVRNLETYLSCALEALESERVQARRYALAKSIRDMFEAVDRERVVVDSASVSNLADELGSLLRAIVGETTAGRRKRHGAAIWNVLTRLDRRRYEAITKRIDSLSHADVLTFDDHEEDR